MWRSSDSLPFLCKPACKLICAGIQSRKSKHFSRQAFRRSRQRADARQDATDGEAPSFRVAWEERRVCNLQCNAGWGQSIFGGAGAPDVARCGAR